MKKKKRNISHMKENREKISDKAKQRKRQQINRYRKRYKKCTERFYRGLCTIVGFQTYAASYKGVSKDENIHIKAFFKFKNSTLKKL